MANVPVVPDNMADVAIFTAARTALDLCPDAPETVRLQVHQGTVTLTGVVRLAGERDAAERVTRAVPGVRRVVNRLRVPPTPTRRAFEPPGVE